MSASEQPQAAAEDMSASLPLSALISIIVGGTFVVCAILATLGLYLSRRRAARYNLVLSGEIPVIVHDVENSSTSEARTSPRKLQKLGGGRGPPLIKDADDSGSLVRRLSRSTLPRVFKKGHRRSRSGPSWGWPASLSRSSSKRTVAWVDEDALHGPDTGSRREPQEGEARDSWPLGNRTPTLPKLPHYAFYRYAQTDQSPVNNRPTIRVIDYAHQEELLAYSRTLPEPPRLTLVTNNDGQFASPGASSSRSSLAQSPTRSLPRTPSRPRVRQPSTDSTLTEILRSTEKRLQEGGAAGSGATARKTTCDRGTRSPRKVSAMGSRESLLGYGSGAGSDEVPTARRSMSRSRTPSPRKCPASQSLTASLVQQHKRQDSQVSAMSEADSLIPEPVQQTDSPSGLTSPSRNPRSQEPEAQVAQNQSARSSLSLSTVYSEDEVLEVMRAAPSPSECRTLPPPAETPLNSATASSTPRPNSSCDWPGRPQHKPQDLSRESLEKSQRLCRVSIGQPPASLPPSIRLPPCPSSGSARAFARAGCSDPAGQRGRVSKTVPVSRAGKSQGSAKQTPASVTAKSAPMLGKYLSPTAITPRTNPSPVFARESSGVVNAQTAEKNKGSSTPRSDSTLFATEDRAANKGEILILPAQSAPGAQEGPQSNSSLSSRIPTTQDQQQQQQQQQRMSSNTSSVYSQDPSSDRLGAGAVSSASDFNRASFLANYSLRPASSSSPLTARPASSSYPPRVDSLGRIAKTKLAPSLPDRIPSRLEEEDEKEDNDDDGTAANGGEGGGGGGGGGARLSASGLTLGAGLAATVAELRRMNSGISTASGRSSSPTGGGVSARMSGSHHYLSLGSSSSSPKRRRRQIMSSSTASQKRRDGDEEICRRPRTMVVVGSTAAGSPQRRRIVMGERGTAAAAAATSNRASFPRLGPGVGLGLYFPRDEGDDEKGEEEHRTGSPTTTTTRSQGKTKQQRATVDFLFEMQIPTAAEFTFSAAAASGSGSGQRGDSERNKNNNNNNNTLPAALPSFQFPYPSRSSEATPTSTSMPRHHHPRNRTAGSGGGGGGGGGSPRRRLENPWSSPTTCRNLAVGGHRRSDDSLGLYDKDGFLIYSPARQGGASPGLRV